MHRAKRIVLLAAILNLVFGCVLALGQGKGRGKGGKEPPPPPPPPPDCNVTYDGYQTRIAFSGYVWAVKDHGNSLAGPGPNRFSDSSRSVWVDDDGRLHLKIRRFRGKWYAAEVINLCTLGYGSYRVLLDSEVDSLDPNVVLGLFTWSDQPAENHRELDIEFARWADPTNQDAQYVVQPYDQPGNIFRFWQPDGMAQTTQILTWTPGQAVFESRPGHADGTPYTSALFTQGVPSSVDENFRFNLWLFRGIPPTDGRDVEVIIKAFEFEPTP